MSIHEDNVTEFDRLMQDVEQEEKDASDFYKLKEGANKVRIISDFIRVESIFNNKVAKGMNYEGRKLVDGDTISMKGWAYGIIRDTEQIKILQLPKTIMKMITALKSGNEYSFESFPMPYDITINAEGAGQKEVKYSVIPARQNTEVTKSEMAELNKKKTLKSISQAILDKQLDEGKKGPDYPESKEPTF